MRWELVDLAMKVAYLQAAARALLKIELVVEVQRFEGQVHDCLKDKQTEVPGENRELQQ